MYKEFYHETGLIWVDEIGFGKDVIANYTSLRPDEKWKIANPKDVKNLYGGLFRNANFGKHEEIFVNESSGWVEASKALQKVIETAVFAGVKSVELDISSLVFDKDGACIGVQSTDGQVLSASHIILATGAETVKLLVESATDIPKITPRKSSVNRWTHYWYCET